jgi:hypothetical protein
MIKTTLKKIGMLLVALCVISAVYVSFFIYYVLLLISGKSFAYGRAKNVILGDNATQQLKKIFSII